MRTALAAVFSICTAAFAEPPHSLDAYNVVWTTPSKDASGSMPLGNGEVGLNAWVEENGDLVFYISRVDSWSECERLLKVGKIRVTLDPPLLGKPGERVPLRQELRSREGEITIKAGEGEKQTDLVLFVDAKSDVVIVSGKSTTPHRVIATADIWRTSAKTLENSEELQSSWAMREAPKDVPREQLTESADVVLNEPGAVAWYHRNEHSIVPFTVPRQGLDDIAAIAPDPFLHRTFGGWMAGSGMKSNGPSALHSSEPTRAFQVRIAVPCTVTGSPAEWIDTAKHLATPGDLGPPNSDDARDHTNAWWDQFWKRSWVRVENDRAALGVPRNAHPLRFGADSNGLNIFRGTMGRASIHSRALSANDVAAIAGAGPVKSLPVRHDCLASWRFRPPPGANGVVLPDGDINLLALAIGDAGFEFGEGDFVGTFRGGHFKVADQKALALPNGLTLEAWINPDKDCGPARIFDKMTAGTSDGFIFDTHPGDALRLICGDVTLSALGALKKGQWQHVAATFDPATSRAALYLDGKLVKATNGATADPAAPSRLTQAYILQRFMLACASRGDFPIKFNGSIFTVEPKFTEGQPFNADWRKWGGSYWWQNTRLPYYPMLAAGDFDGMHSLFGFYERCLPACRARTKLYYGAEGVYFPETMTTFATYANGDYGWKRNGLDRSDISPCPWWQWTWQQGLELSQLMLDYAAYTGDDAFLRQRAIPMASESLRYYDSRFKRDAGGKLIISPTQAAETYWKDVINDAPSVAGLHAVCDQLLALPASIGTPDDRALWTRVRSAASDLPLETRNGVKMLAPAEKFDPARSNCETPELYSVFPFRLRGIGQPDIAEAIAAYQHRHDKATHGWTQDGMVAAMLGLTEEAKANLLAKCRNSNKNFRFPAMWGPNFDWLPDQCHGGNLMTTTQLMLMQCYDERIYLLPAWPKDWNVSFKLHAPKQTTVECVYQNGKVLSLVVTPESRRADVVMPSP